MPDFRKFSIWRTNYRCEVSSGASCPVEAMIWISEIESAKSIAELKTSDTITGTEVRTNFEVLDSKIACGLEGIINGHFEMIGLH